MGRILYGCATTTEAIRRTIQLSQESLRTLTKRYGVNPKTVNPKTVAKWKKRGFIAPAIESVYLSEALTAASPRKTKLSA